VGSDPKPRQWRGIEEREGTAEFQRSLKSEFPAPPSVREGSGGLADPLHRRSFLKAAGFTLGGGMLAASCQRGAEEKLVPLLVGDQEGVPGKNYWYATTCGGCSAGCGVLTKNRDGRPIKIEGNPDHPLSRGGVCAVGQATILGLYDSLRLDRPRIAGQPVDWERLDHELGERLGQVHGGVVFLTGTITSPSTQAAIQAFLERFPDSEHVRYDPLSSSAILAAHEHTFGRRVLPHYRFERAQIIVGFEADFLGTWISPVEFTKAYTAGRSLEHGAESFCRHVQFEGRLSLTGSNADQRIAAAPEDCARALLRLAALLAEKAGEPLPEHARRCGTELHDEDEPVLREIAEALWDARGSSLVVCGADDVALQCVTNFVNHVLGNYGSTLDVEHPSLQAAGDDRALEALIGRMQGGKVQALFLAGVNPAYSLPRAQDFVAGLDEVGLKVSFAEHLDETAELCTFVCPLPHFLEAWDDKEVVSGLVGVAQPVVAPLGNTRTLRETLARWSGASHPDYELVRAFWKERLFPLQTAETSFDSFWNRALQDGFTRVERPSVVLGPFRWPGGFLEWPAAANTKPAGTLALVLYPKVGMLEGRHAHNPWLQELPDPVTKAVWDNYACLAPALAGRLGIAQGDVVRVRTGDAELELPVLLQPGQHESVVAIAVGYGRKGTDRFEGIGPNWLFKHETVAGGGTVGRNAFVLGQRGPAGIRLSNAVTLEATGKKYELAQTQTHHTLKEPEELGGRVRDHVHETSLAAYRKDPAAGNPREGEAAQLWQDDHPYEGHLWGLAIDLNRCTGCSACLIGCQSENNVPVVGKDEVLRRREMHWIRIDRYYAGDDSAVEVVHQPVMCQHCGNAPCETVCPTLATVHSSEGLNQQVYNRCVGTRYCANNCPYKVRRFNWFEYWTEEMRENLALNPDVATRSRGVMEKCSLCVQRIQEGKAEAARRGIPMKDGDVQTACQQSCPGDAIVFGDRNDPNSRVAKLAADPRHYHLLESMNLRPGVGYLTKVRDREPDSS
jgi:molybdopterin-containing oxidoreductase family iron-sulfur binding subunit